MNKGTKDDPFVIDDDDDDNNNDEGGGSVDGEGDVHPGKPRLADCPPFPLCLVSF